jgi:hypothetical protein
LHPVMKAAAAAAITLAATTMILSILPELHLI